MAEIKLKNQVRRILACPYCKSLDIIMGNDNQLHCTICGATFKVYPNGVADFRVMPPVPNALFEKYWAEGQIAYEKWAKSLSTNVEFYREQIRHWIPIYSHFFDMSSVKGVLLDVGGNDGRLRHYLSPSPECIYVSIDPYLTQIHENFPKNRLKSGFRQLQH